MAPASVATALATLATRAPGLQPVPLPDGIAVTRVLPGEPPPPLIAHAPYTGRFERDWQVTSFTALTRLLTTPTPQTAREMAALADEGEAPASPPVEPGAEAPWHRFPRGALPGNFVHGELEWLAETGFARAHDADFADRVKRRCEHAGWSRHAEDLAHWLRRIVSIPLPPIGQPLTALRTWQAEMEFWFPSEGVAVSEIDHLCQVALLDGRPRAPLPARALQGMLKGYVDLVFEHEGRYWVLDYKSNVLGAHDAAYTSGAIQQAMADHRYDVQGMVYLLALHRLLRHRLGPAYDPNRHLGGAIFFFLRGLDGPVAGCETLPVVPAMLDLLEASVETTA
jgi:exodeoxyribonuclease V beta subunit